MHTHTVFFWLRNSASNEDRQKFRAGLDHLMQDPNVQHSVIGEPAKTSREVVERSYDFGAVVTFKNLADHNTYQVGKHHDEFLEMCKDLWSRVVVYDIAS